MNFVDVQPKSFLDYAWTTPSPAPVTITKSSKTSRKQNRCCDQCRKGKRACDAAILEDTLLDKSGGSCNTPTAFHYSDVFGPLAPCGNCEKTKKACTFEWLRSQRVSQASPQSGQMPPTKKRRKSSSSTASPHRSENKDQTGNERVCQETAVLPCDVMDQGDMAPQLDDAFQFNDTLVDFPRALPSFELGISSSDPDRPLLGGWEETAPTEAGMGMLRQHPDAHALDQRDSGNGSSISSSSEAMSDTVDGESPLSHDISIAVDMGYGKSAPNAVVRLPRNKRRRLSSWVLSRGNALPTSLSVANDLTSSANNAILAEGLLKIYHDSFENALSCWLTERTCPYSKNCEVSLAGGGGPDWNRIYQRVFKLDRLAAGIRGRSLTLAEDKAASKAINAAIFSFATQWAQSSEQSRAKYPFHGKDVDDQSDDDRSRRTKRRRDVSSHPLGFDRILQVSAWYEAREALQSAAEIESFRVVLAQIVFSLTQRPTGGPDQNIHGVAEPEIQGNEDSDVQECDDLMTKLNLTIDAEGPPIHLEQGLRLIHSLRSRMAMNGCRGSGAHSNGLPTRSGRQSSNTSDQLDTADQATVDLLFWLGVMFDTLSSAMHKRPLVVSDEDSDIYSDRAKPTENAAADKEAPIPVQDSNPSGLWDDYLLARQQERLQEAAVKWPCSFDQASSLLCDAAPVKVLLFRKITRIQTLMLRGVRGQRIEGALHDALQVYEHWGRAYGSFVQDCIENYDGLPARIQSWYICLAGHWYLATLLLADLMEIVDDSKLGLEVQRNKRMAAGFVADFRATNCRALSDLARCACPREDSTFPKDREYHFAVNQGAILTEPWTVVLIRAFAKAGVVLLESGAAVGSDMTDAHEDAFRRADDCVKALWYLGRKSDMALSAAKILGDALKERKKGLEEKMSDMSSFLEAELWEGLAELDPVVGVDCE